VDKFLAKLHVKWSGFDLDVDLNLPTQGVTALFGPSGCGKTTILRCIAGLEKNVQGRVCLHEVVWQDEHVWVPPYQREIGYVFQEASLFPHLTVLENLEYGLKRSKHQQGIDIHGLIDLLGIAALLKRKPHALSGGERQRVGIARALAVKPRLLLMDEPLAALDNQRKQEILPYLDKLHRELAIPVLYVTHSSDEVARLAHHIVVLDQGHVVASGGLLETLSRIDLPIKLGDDLGAVIEASVGEVDSQWHLSRCDFSGGGIWTRSQGLSLHQKIRLRVLARDVSIATERPVATSIQNSLQGSVVSITDDEQAGYALVRILVGTDYLIARVTQRALHELSIQLGQAIWVQVKSVAIAQ
jgi:molybdate transport system ATP-binding protein